LTKVPHLVCIGATEVGKAPVPAKKGTTKVGNKSVSVPLLKLLIGLYPLKIYVLAEKLILQLVYLADNRSSIDFVG